MNINLNFKSLIVVALLSGSTSLSASDDNKLSRNDLAPEATADQVQHGFWKNPNLNYITTGWPIDADDFRIDHVPKLENAFVDTAPTDRNDGLVMGELGVDGGDKDMIVKLVQDIADGQHGEFDSLLIAHKGKLVLESYYLWGRVNLTHPQSSATKTYTGLALGRAIQLGYLSMADLDKPLVSFLKDLDPTKFVAGAEKITVNHALTMSSGIRISKQQHEEMDKYPDRLKGQGRVQALLEHSAPITEESQVFKYGFGPELVMQVIDAVVPGSAEDFIKNELLGKMDVTTYEWLPGGAGLPAAGWKSSITSRTMLKFGVMAMNKGKWNGEQLVPEAFIAKAINRIVRHSDDKNFSDDGNISNTGYGYFWWQADMKVANKNYFSTSARGGGGQYIILIEELDLIVVMTGWHSGDDQNLQMTAERILPAFVQSDIEGPYLGQKPPGLIPEVFAPGIVSLKGRNEGAVSFSPDLDEIYFPAKKKGENWSVYFSKLENKKWTNLKKANFTKSKSSVESHPFVSPSGKRIYFVDDNDKIWYVNRFEGSWGDAIQLDLPINDDIVFNPIEAKNGDLYYFNVSKMKLYYAPNKNGEFPEVHEVEIEFGVHGFISPSQDFLVVDARNKNNDNDLYVYFKKQDGTWTKPFDLGNEVNSDFHDSSPRITPDGKYLFFSRSEEDERSIYWVSTEVIENLRPK